MVEDFEKFPSGMKALGDWIKQHDTYAGSGEKMHYGLYSCRGTYHVLYHTLDSRCTS